MRKLKDNISLAEIEQEKIIKNCIYLHLGLVLIIINSLLILSENE